MLYRNLQLSAQRIIVRSFDRCIDVFHVPFQIVDLGVIQRIKIKYLACFQSSHRFFNVPSNEEQISKRAEGD